MKYLISNILKQNNISYNKNILIYMYTNEILFYRYLAQNSKYIFYRRFF
jgi:hypothetical protein